MSERIYLSPPDVGPSEREALLRAFDSGWIAPVGPELDAFERELASELGWDGVVATSSGTAALHLALQVSGVGPGDDVLVSTFTFAASANAVVYCGAQPVFVDSETASWNMSPELLASELQAARRANRVPKAVVVVDLYGQCADYDAIIPQCRELDIPIIEDAAEALGAWHHDRPAGTICDAGVLSFNGNKIITTSTGGAFTSPDVAIADRVRYLATQARQPEVHYQHRDVGYNYRMSNLLAAIGRAQLVRLSAMSARRQQINQIYRELLSDVDVTFMPVAPWGRWNGWLTCLLFGDPSIRQVVQKALSLDGIESRPLWKPMHLQPVFERARSRVDGTSEWLFDHGVCLPSGSNLSDSQVRRVARVVHWALTHEDRRLDRRV